MANLSDNVPIVGATDVSGEDRVKDAFISGNILFVSKSGLDTGKGNYGTPFLTIQKAIDTHGDPSDAADEKITKAMGSFIKQIEKQMESEYKYSSFETWCAGTDSNY